MRIALLIVVLAFVAVAFNLRWLATGVLMFVLACALWGFGEFVCDIFTGFNVQSTIRRARRKAR